jgi:ATP-binding cassette subfamily B protein
MVGDALTFVGMFIVMFIVHWKLALITASVLPPIFFGAWLFQKKTTKRFLMVRKRMADIMAFVTEHLQGMHVIQLFNQEGRAIDRMIHANRRKFDTEFSAEFAVVVFFNTLFFMELVGIALILWRGGLWAIQGVVTVGTLMMFIGYVRRFFQPIHHLSEQLSIFQKAFASSKRIFHLLDMEPVIDDAAKPVRWKSLEQGIEFRDVWFSYNEKDWALKGVSFRIPRGERWALVGQTGSGKTSIVNLLLRFYDCQRGSVEVDGLDIRNIRQKELREKIALVLQDVFIFPGSVLENVRLGNEDIAPERVADALKTVCPEELLERLSDGLDTELAERGKDLSTGERQLLSFARALAFDPEILLLDEATSSVDPATEAAIRDALTLLLQGRTSIIVAHRLSTVISSDKILVVHDGKIVEQGSHWDLLKQGGHYSRLYELQLAQTCEAEEVREHG